MPAVQGVQEQCGRTRIAKDRRVIGCRSCLPDLDDRAVSYPAGLSYIGKNFKKMLDKKGWRAKLIDTTLWHFDNAGELQ